MHLHFHEKLHHFFYSFYYEYSTHFSWKSRCLEIKYFSRNHFTPFSKSWTHCPKTSCIFFLISPSCWWVVMSSRIFAKIFLFFCEFSCSESTDFNAKMTARVKSFSVGMIFQLVVTPCSFFLFLFYWFVLFSFVLFHLFLGCTQLQQASTDTICCCHLSHWTFSVFFFLICFPFVEMLKCTTVKSHQMDLYFSFFST